MPIRETDPNHSEPLERAKESAPPPKKEISPKEGGRVKNLAQATLKQVKRVKIREKAIKAGQTLANFSRESISKIKQFSPHRSAKTAKSEPEPELKKTSVGESEKNVSDQPTNDWLKATPSKVREFTDYVFVARGAEKKVYKERLKPSLHRLSSDDIKNSQGSEKTAEKRAAFYIPVETWRGTKEKALRIEMKTMNTINERLKALPEHLATEFEETEIEGKFALKVPLSEGDFEKEMKKGLSFEEHIEHGLGIIKGVAELHRAGFVHGDLKPENALIGRDEQGNKVLRLADFGKARDTKIGKEILYSGNPRFAPPERILTEKGDVYATALILIRNFEEHVLLLKNNGDVPKDSNSTLLGVEPDQREGFAIPEDKHRRGVERFILENKAFKAIDSGKDWNQKVTYVKRRTDQMYLTEADKQAQNKELNTYIDAMAKEARKHIPQENFVSGYSQLLKAMIQTDPDKRPTIDIVLEAYEALQKSI
jgi:serine/threonine protein kinase